MKGKRLLAFLLALIFLLQLNSVSYAQTTFYGVEYAPSIYHNMIFKDIQNSFAKYDIMKMAALSVIRGGGDQKFYPKSYLKKEEALAYIVRLTNTSSSTGVAGSMPATLPPKFKVDDWAKGVIDAALKANLLTKDELNTDFTLNATREEVAYWLAKGLGFQPLSGTDLQQVYTFRDVKDINSSYLPYVGAVVKRGIMSGYSDGKFRPKTNITREQMASVLNRVFNYSYSLMGYSVLTGTIKNILQENLVGEGAMKNTFVISNQMGQENFVVTKVRPSSNGGGHLLDFLTISNGKPVYSQAFTVGDKVRFYIKDGKVIFAEKLPQNETVVYGEIVNITPSTIALKGGYNYSNTFSYTPYTEVYINDYPASTKDLRVGQTILAYLEGGTAYRIDVNYEEYASDKIEAGSRQVTGSIISIQNPQGDLRKGGIDITLDSGDTYYISPNTPLVKGGVSASLSSLKIGDYVNLIFDDPYSDTPIKVLVDNGYYNVTGVFRGTLGSVMPLSKVINLSNVEKYYQGTWQKVSDYVSYPFEKAEFYLNGLKIDESSLKNYTGRTIYITTENHFGKEYITFANIVSPFTMAYQGMASFDPYSMTLTLSDGRKVTVNDGTIVVKGGRRVPANSLKSNQVYVSFSKEDNLYANFVSVIDTVDVPSYYYAKGYLFYATANSVTVGDVPWRGSYYSTVTGYYEISNNQWSFVSGSRVFYVGDSTFVVDNRDKESKVVPYSELLNIRYGSSRFKDAFAYVVANGDNAVAINVMPSDNNERVSTAKVEGIEGTKVTVSEVKDWNEVEGIWNLNTSLEVVDLSKAVIVKDGRTVDVSSLKKGDFIYMIRSASRGIIVTVK
ncbi:S-layer homology domain-containing protein [Caldanaerobacter subterraneus]|uniref:S-layer homology domain-containing protein n=1 Tax=Caldanaerobacter subterraneus TaxID=911092 RepID=A0A7Y2L8V1_9THEO|nr:S-layer homology domain-containing protein [Caldanaerobacter subterraneus]NNG67760.1 S-layer homology domain-containing protein [Caldanaerobacter subterraneus]